MTLTQMEQSSEAFATFSASDPLIQLKTIL